MVQAALLLYRLSLAVRVDEALLTPATHSVLPTRHHIFTLLVLPRDHLEFYAGVSHPMVSMGKEE